MSTRKPTYLLRTELIQGELLYFVTILANTDCSKEVIVSEAVYNLLKELAKQDRHISHQIERHNEYSEQTDETLNKRATCKPKLLEDSVIDKLLVEQILTIVKALPSLQARRFMLRNILGLSYPEIAHREGCSARAVKYSVDLATKQIREKLKL
jgi:RNA polymerase sigma-70 factor (ECF subfamily)